MSPGRLRGLLAQAGIFFLAGAIDGLAQADSAESRQAAPSQATRPHAGRDPRIEELLNRMTPEEWIGQASMINAPAAIATGDLTDGGWTLEAALAEIRAGRIGSFLNGYGVDQVRRLQTEAVERSPRKIPLVFGFDVLRGHRTVFPCPLAEAASWDAALAERTARAAAIEASAQGLDWTFGPDADVARDARWGRVMETFGEDPFLSGEFVAAKVRGFQGERLDSPDSMASTLKHFIGYGAALGGRDYASVSISPTDLYNVHLVPFLAGFAAGARALMPSFTDVDSVPMSAHRELMSGLLRGRIGFSGLVVSDWESIRETIAHGVAANQPQAARQALAAEIDVDMVGGSYRSLAGTPLTERERRALRTAARRVLEFKRDLGLFENPYRRLDASREATQLLLPATRRLAREAVAKTATLLKNEGALPLRRGRHRAAIVGPLADAPWATQGEWMGAGRADEVVTARAAFSAPGYFRQIAFAPGSPALTDAREIASLRLRGEPEELGLNRGERDFAEAIAMARAADVTIAVVGELHWMSGESASRANPSIPAPQMALLHALRPVSRKLVTIVIAGRPLLLKEALELSDALLYAWLPGTEAGNGLRDLVFGEAIPSAKTAISFPRSVGQLPLFYNRKSTGRPAEPGRPFRSRYLDEENEALIPFGFGLGFSKIEYGPTELSKPSLSSRPGDEVVARARLTNVGAYDAEEAAQLYLRDEVASIARPVVELKGFQRIRLRPGETKEVEFRIGRDALSFFNSRFERVIEPGRFQIAIAPNSADLRWAPLEYDDRPSSR